MLNKLYSVLTLLVGKFSWSTPPWIKHLQNKASANPKKFWASTLISLLMITAIWATYHWYQSLPKPERVTAKISIPKLTPVDTVLYPDVLTLDFGLPSGNEVSARPVAPLSVIGKEVTDGVSITPNIQGNWRWDTDSRLVFTPSTDWPAGQTYTIKFNKSFFTAGTKMASWHYSFTTLPFTASIAELKLYQNPLNPQARQAVATVNFSFPVDASSFENKVKLMWQTLGLSEDTIKFTLNYDEHKRKAYIKSEQLPLPQAERFLQLTLRKGIQSATGSSATTETVTQKLLIPDASSYFKVSKLATSIVRNQKDQPEQVFTLETSLGVTEAELIKSLHAYLLPQDYPANSAEEAKTNYKWSDPGEVSPAILTLAKPISLEAIPADRDYASLHSFRYHADTPSYLFVTLDKGIHSFGDFALSNPYQAILKVPAYPQEITFLHKGALLALGTEEKLSVLVRGLGAVKFDIARVLPDDINHLITQTGGDFSNPYFLNTNFTQDNISEIFSQTQQFDASDVSKAQYTALDLSKYLAAPANKSGSLGLFLLQAHGWDMAKKITLNAQANRLILITDLGLIVKDNVDASHDVFVQSITRGLPVSQATVELLGKNGLPILTRVTDAQGHANFPAIKDLSNDKDPTVYLVRNGNDISFIPYYRYDRVLNYSRYDIGGITSYSDAQSAITAYLFSDRGIYRPGDTSHIGMIVKQPYVLPQPAGLPLEATIVDPRGVTVKDEKISLNESGYLSFDFQTTDTSPTGQYMVNLYIVKDNHASSLIGSTTIQVGEFLPDRMRITEHLSTEQASGWLSPNGLTANVGLWNLYGAPAVNHRVSGKILLTPQAIKFKEFPDYTFVDPLLDPKTPPKVYTDTLAETRTDDQGQAVLNLKLDRFEKATYQLTVFAEGFEAEGGRSVTTQTKALISPLAYLVGYKANGDLTYIKQDGTRSVHLIAVNPQLKQQGLNNLNLTLYNLHPVSTLVKKEDGTYEYQSIIQSTQVSKTNLNINVAGFDYLLPSKDIGDFLVTISDQNNMELTKFKYSIVGSSQLPLPKNAELTVKLNKAEFNAGDGIEMQITAPYTGAGLITIERDKVYATQWFKTDTTSSIQKIRIPSDFKGDGYVNISFVRDLNSPEIFMSPLSYSVAPFSVNHNDHKVQVDLTVPTLARPGTPLVINYKTDKPSKIIVFAVDQGILQVTRYQAPDPLTFFFQKHALEVTTLQIVDQILPKFMADRELSAVGGDGGESALDKSLNPFKRKTDAPVVYWSGIIESDATPRQVTYNIPDYFNGSLKVMAVAVAQEAVGAAATTSEVRGHFVISPNVPTFVAPGDEFEVSTSIANNVDGSGKTAAITVALTATPQLEIIGDAKQQVVVPEGQERSVHFKLKAKAQLGSAELSFTASLGDKASKMASTLSVRPALAFTSNLTSGYTNDAAKSLLINQALYPEYRKVDITVSQNPLILVTGLQNYLNDYPYGCVEQLVSKALPWLALVNQPWYSAHSVELRDKIQKTIQLLSQRQMSSGAFNYWPEVGSTQSNEFASVYAMHFLTEARAQGFTVPSDVFSAGIGYLRNLATQDVDDMNQARIHAYAIYVLTRNEIVTTNYLTNLQLTLEQSKYANWHNDILCVYIAATYQMLKNTADAEKILRSYKPTTGSETTDFYNQYVAQAQYLYLLAKHFPDKLASVGPDLVESLVNALNDNTLSTILAGYSTLALSSDAQYASTANAATLTISGISPSGKQTDLSSSSDVYQQAAIDVDTAKLAISNPGKQGYYYQLNQAGFANTLPTKAIYQGIEVYREYKNSDDNAFTQLKLGDEVIVHIRARSVDNNYHSNIAIVDLLPGGFEVVRDSIQAPNMEYVDAREDRVIFFGGLGSDSIELIYRIKATNIGSFIVPPVFGSAMYNPMIQSTGVAGTITVGGT